MVVGAGIFAVPASLAASIGPYAPIAFVVCAIAIGSIAICFAEGGSRVPTSGGAYGYVESRVRTAGRLCRPARCCGFPISLPAAASLRRSATSPRACSRPSGASAVRVAVVFLSVGSDRHRSTSAASRAARASYRSPTVVKLIPLAIFIVVGATGSMRSNFAMPSARRILQGIGRALILALFAFTGMEVSLCASGEVARADAHDSARARSSRCCR